MAKTKRPGLVDRVLAKAARSKPGLKSWFERLPADLQDELLKVRDAFDPSIHQKRPYARLIIEEVSECGFEVCGVQGVLAWLNAKR